MANGPDISRRATVDAILRWLDSIGAAEVLDWRLVEQPSGQYPAGRWEALVERNGTEAWVLAPPEEAMP